MAERRFRSMGCDVVVLGPDDRDAASSVQLIFEDWDRRFSRFRVDSELEQLNDAGSRSVVVSDLMLRVVDAAVRAARGSDGLFDPLLGGRMRELGYDRTYDELPAWRPRTPLGPWRAGAWREIAIDRDRGTIRLPVGYRLDLGGIAKGMAVDAAVDALVIAGFPFAAVNAGGDLAVTGLPPGQSSWPISIDGFHGTTVALPHGAMATSSVLRRRWRVGGGERHHLLDPRSGMPATGRLVQASVAAGTCGQAEVAAKVAILSDLRGAIAHLERHRLAGLLITDEGAVFRVGTWQ